jgi:hypothetical protein
VTAAEILTVLGSLYGEDYDTRRYQSTVPCPRCSESLTVVDEPGHRPFCAGGCSPEDVQAELRAVLKRDPAPEDGAALLDQLAAFIRRFVVMSAVQVTVLVLWVVHTAALDAAETTPYLAITSPEKRSGKTRLLELLELLVPRPWLTGRVTAAVLARKVDAERPTLLLDESDAAFKGDKEYAEALRGLLNTGHRVGGKASICVGQGANLSYRDFSTFGAKAIAGIGGLPDTVADRSIPIRLARKGPDETAERFRRREVEPEATRLRERVERFAAGSLEALAAARPHLPDQLDDRGQDAAEPLLAIADLAGGDWPARARQALVELRDGVDVDDESSGVRLLADIRQVFGAAERLATTELLNRLSALEESPWGDWHGRPLTSRALAKLLKPYGVKSRSVRVADDSTPKGYQREQFEDAWKRYLSSNPPEERHNATTRSQSGIEADLQTPQDSVVAELREPANPYDKRDVADVADTGSKRDRSRVSDPDEEAVDREAVELQLARERTAAFANAGRAKACRCERPMRSVNAEGERACWKCGKRLAVAA